MKAAIVSSSAPPTSSALRYSNERSCSSSSRPARIFQAQGIAQGIDRVAAAGVGRDVVDVLDENDVGVDLVEVLDEGAVAGGPEEQRAVVLAEGGVVGVDGDRVGRGLLRREGDVVADAVALLVEGHLLVEQLAEALDVLGRDGEVDADRAGRDGVGGTLGQMLLDGLAGPLGVGVEGDEPLGLRAVTEPLLDDGAHDRAVVGPGGQDGLQLGPEGEALDVLQQFVDARAALALVDEGEELLEHARGGSRGGDELDDPQFVGGGLVAGDRRLGAGAVDHRHAVGGRGGPHDRQAGEAAAEVLDLALDGLDGQPVGLDLSFLLFGKHRSYDFRIVLSGWFGPILSPKLIKISNFAA